MVKIFGAGVVGVGLVEERVLSARFLKSEM